MILIQLGNNLEKPFITKIWSLNLKMKSQEKQTKEHALKQALRALKTVMDIQLKPKPIAGETGL